MQGLLLSLFLSLAFCHLSFADQTFSYDLHLSYISGDPSKIMVVAHGMGGNYTIAQSIKASGKVPDTLVSFNFPDYDSINRVMTIDEVSYGTINELLPLLYVIKKSVIDDNYKGVNLYGFSAGGGAIINALAVLNADRFDTDLKKIGINQKEKKEILLAIQKGLIILDTPLKSIQEIIDFRGTSQDLEILAKRYRENDMEPIDAIKYLKGLTLRILVHFQNPDEILSNRDDRLFFERLKMYNPNGETRLIMGNDNGHIVPHPSLWDAYSN